MFREHPIQHLHYRERYESSKRESVRTGNTRDLVKKIKGTFHPRMGMIKDRNSKDLIEAEDIRK